MSTVNISLPKEQISFIDQLVVAYGFANRSEFVRSVIRLIHSKPNLIESAATFPFVPPTERSVSKIVNDFRKTKKYNAAFLKDLEQGLSDSSYFTKKKKT